MDEEEDEVIPRCVKCKTRARRAKYNGVAYADLCVSCDTERRAEIRASESLLPPALSRAKVGTRLRPVKATPERSMARKGMCPDCAQEKRDSAELCDRCTAEKARAFAQRRDYMETLTDEDKVAGRLFVTEAQGLLDERNLSKPAGLPVPHYLAVIRHDCPGSAGRTTPVELKEIYDSSPSYCVHNGVARESKRGDRCRGGVIPAGRFGFLYREGQCRHCGLIARSRTGRLVDGWSRPPINGRKGS